MWRRIELSAQCIWWQALEHRQASAKIQCNKWIQGSGGIAMISGRFNPLAQPRDCNACETLEFMEGLFLGDSGDVCVRKEVAPWMFEPSFPGSLARYL